ncbi:MAG: hypothetical protein ACOYXT_13875 [Bacteroidota bacterium]
MKESILLTIQLFVLLLANAQSASTLIGARANGLGYASTCIEDAWSVFNNPGGLVQVEHTTASVSLDLHPWFKSFNRIAAMAALPLARGVGALGTYKFGDDLYNETILSGVYSSTFGLASLGLKLNYIQYHASDFGTRAVVTLSFGGIARLTNKLSVGAHISNINQPRISEDEAVPTWLCAGLGFKPQEKIFVTTEIEKNLTHAATWKTGVEYAALKKVFFRTGFNLSPDAAFFGIGFHPKKLNFDFAAQYHESLGSNFQTTVIYQFKSK